MCDILSASCSYLNRHYVQFEYHRSRRDILEIEPVGSIESLFSQQKSFHIQLSQQIWENVFFKPLFLRVTDACLNVINTNRNNQTSIDTESIEKILQLYCK